MSNEPDTFVDYFKIKWSRKAAWTLSQGAHLSCGKNPDNYSSEISLTASNPIGQRLVWLTNKRNKGELSSVGTENGMEYFNRGSIFRLLAEKYKIDKDMQKALDHMYEAPFGINHIKFVSRSVYREAGRLIYLKYPNATMMSVAEALVGLHEYYNNDDFGHIEKLEAKQIAQLLRKLGDLEQKPKNEDKPAVEVNLSELIKKL